MKILLTNDDGIYAPGLAGIHAQLTKLGDVTVVAPLDCRSGMSHSITFIEPVTCLPIKVNVVAERTKDNMYIPPKPMPVTTIILILAVVAIVIWYLNKFGKKSRPVVRSKKRVVKRSVKKPKKRSKKRK